MIFHFVYPTRQEKGATGHCVMQETTSPRIAPTERGNQKIRCSEKTLCQDVSGPVTNRFPACPRERGKATAERRSCTLARLSRGTDVVNIRNSITATKNNNDVANLDSHFGS